MIYRICCASLLKLDLFVLMIVLSLCEMNCLLNSSTITSSFISSLSSSSSLSLSYSPSSSSSSLHLNSSIIIPLSATCTNCSLPNSDIHSIKKQIEEQDKAITNVTIETFKESQKRTRERSRQERLDQVLEQILARTGISNPRIIKPEMHQKVNSILLKNVTDTIRNVQSNIIIKPEVLAKKFFSFYASCSLPAESEPDVWRSCAENEYRFFFNTSSLDLYFEKGAARVLETRLRLLVSNASFDCNLICKSITATLYRYNRPLRRNELENYDAVDSKIFTQNFSGLLTFKIDPEFGKQFRNSSENHGFFIKLEDELGNSLKTSSFFSQNVCSNTNIAIPVLSEFLKMTNATNEFSQGIRYPILDIIMVETINNQPEKILSETPTMDLQTKIST